MKRIAAMVCVGLFVIGGMVGCGKNTVAVQPVTSGFSCDVSADVQGMTVKGTLSRETTGQLCMQVTEPPSLRDVMVEWDGTTMTMQLGGVSIPVEAAHVPQGALVKQVLAVLTAAPSKTTATDEGTVVDGVVDGKPFSIVCDSDTGLIRSLSIPQDDLTVTFDNTKTIT